MADTDFILISAERYLSRRELICVDRATKERVTRPLYTFDQIVFYIFVPLKFMQDNALLTSKLIQGPESISEDFELRRNDLTPLGYELFRVAYPKWLGACDRRGAKGSNAAEAEQIRQEWLRSPNADQVFKSHLKTLTAACPNTK